MVARHIELRKKENNTIEYEKEEKVQSKLTDFEEESLNKK